jgi:hypothetical protein
MFPVRKALITAALVGSSLAGGVVGANLIGTAGAADTSTTAPSNPTANGTATPPAGAPAGFDPARGGHVGANGTKEELLTGDTADKVRAAALAAVPGATVQRVETDAEGSPYEAHIVRPDGSMATVKVGSDFKATGVEEGHGR